MKKVLITLSSIFVAALLIVNAFVLYAGEGNSKSRLLLGKVASYASDWNPDISYGSTQMQNTPSETTNNTCTFGSVISITIKFDTSYSLTGTLSQNVNMNGTPKVVNVSYNLGSVLSSSTYMNYGTTYTHYVTFTKNNAFVRDCLNEDYVTLCQYYSECNDLIRQAQSFAQTLATLY